MYKVIIIEIITFRFLFIIITIYFEIGLKYSLQAILIIYVVFKIFKKSTVRNIMTHKIKILKYENMKIDI